MHTPGHTTGSLCYLIEDALFTGDTLFGGGCGRLFEGSPKQMYDALNSRIKPLPPQTKVYFGHEYTATISNLPTLSNQTTKRSKNGWNWPRHRGTKDC